MIDGSLRPTSKVLRWKIANQSPADYNDPFAEDDAIAGRRGNEGPLRDDHAPDR
jgi:hypothetical protein